jgi:hypothetical protein
MLNLRRTAIAVAGCALASAAPPLAAAASTNATHKIETTQRIIALSSTSHGVVNVGTTDGKIAGATVHGALRAIAQRSVSTFTATGALFYPAGILRYRLTGASTENADGSTSITATGKFTGGTGHYANAHGKFAASGETPPNSQVETWTLTGKVSYR